jgi:carboxylesterase
VRFRWWWPPVGLLLAVVLFVTGLFLWPLGVPRAPEPDGASSWTEAAEWHDETLRDEAAAGVDERCGSRLISPGFATKRVVVLIHGFTNCPAQFEQLATELADESTTVFIPRMPRHGLADRLSTEPGDLDIDELIAFADATANIAVGLGDEVTVAGLSAGGVIAAWMAETRADVDRVVVMAPSIGFKAVPTWAGRPFTNLIRILPGFTWWWDSDLKEDLSGPDYAAPFFITSEIGEFFRLGQHILEGEGALPSSELVLLTNENDEAISNPYALGLARLWEDRGAPVTACGFDLEMRLPHDFIDPNQSDEDIADAYPIVLQALTGDIEAIDGQIECS